MSHASSIWNYRMFILSSIRTELISRFIRSRLGGLWMIINPLAQVLMYTLILSAILSAKLPGIDHRFAYAIYLTAGILAWSLFAEVVGRCLTIFIDNSGLLKKLVFPRICLPVIVSGSALLNTLLLFLAVLLVFAALGHFPGVHLLWIPVLILLNLLLALGLGLTLGVLNVFVRDVGQITQLALQYGFWFTPIVYMPAILPEKLQPLLMFNPMYWIVSGYQNALVFSAAPPLKGLAVVAALAFLLVFIAFFLFRRASPEMVDVL